MAFFDVHSHLQDIKPLEQLPHQLSAAHRVGVQHIHSCGTHPDNWPLLLKIANDFHQPQIFVSLGVHPWFLKKLSQNWFDSLQGHSHLIHGIGEIGLDKNMISAEISFEMQLEVFLKQLNFAISIQKPITIHCYKAWNPLLKILKNQLNNQEYLPGLIFHSFSGDADIIPILEKFGGYFSYSRFLEKSKKMQKTLTHIPLNRLLAETDSQKTPDDLPQILKLISEFRTENPYEIESHCFFNAQKLFMGGSL